MIKPNELRLQNKVSALNVLDTVVGLDEDGKIACSFRGYMDPQDVEPIPLTTEMLVRCGFSFGDGANKEYLGIDTKRGRMFLTYHQGDAAKCSLYQDGKMIDFPSGAVKYLHELQNLYFSLTHTELNIAGEW